MGELGLGWWVGPEPSLMSLDLLQVTGSSAVSEQGLWEAYKEISRPGPKGS